MALFRAILGEAATGVALTAGWALITAAIAALTNPIAWIFSAGLYLISLGGWKMLYQIASEGLYVLTRDGRR